MNNRLVTKKQINVMEGETRVHFLITLIYIVSGQRFAQDVVDYPDRSKRLYINGDAQELIDFNKTDP